MPGPPPRYQSPPRGRLLPPRGGGRRANLQPGYTKTSKQQQQQQRLREGGRRPEKSRGRLAQNFDHSSIMASQRGRCHSRCSQGALPAAHSHRHGRRRPQHWRQRWRRHSPTSAKNANSNNSNNNPPETIIKGRCCAGCAVYALGGVLLCHDRGGGEICQKPTRKKKVVFEANE